MDDVRPYTITFPSGRIANLRERIRSAIYPNQLEDVGWDLGTPLCDVQRIAKHWSEKFDFRYVEDNLNSLPNFVTTIAVDGFGELAIHFVYAKSEATDAIPLLFSHGWPGSFIEVMKLLPHLTKGGTNGPKFHVVAPSLPNFGFSGGVKKRGFAIEQYAEVCHKLMLKLGWDKYVTQGGELTSA